MATLAVLALLPGACGDDPVAESSTSTTAEVTTTTAEPTTTTTAGALALQSRLRMDGIGPVRMGMTLVEASTAVGRPVEVDPSYLRNDGEPTLCAFAFTPLDPGGPAKVGFMVDRESGAEEWRIVRTDIEDDLPTATEEDIRVGSTETEVKAAYPTVRVEGHPYREDGHYMIVDPDGSGGLLLIFETDGDKVERFRSGQEASVQAIEGCS
ncbi:MAG: hypothetical protein ACRDZ7_00785 [Acidimicrobiia bacterium]